MLNDSILGPFEDLETIMRDARWDLTAFTASSAFENHVQSFAFLLRDVTHRRLDHLSSVLSPYLTFGRFDGVVNCLETRLARVAARRMRVGALWFCDERGREDAPLFRPLELLADGFPFLKKSLLGKHARL